MAVRIPKPDERFTREEAEVEVAKLEQDQDVMLIASVSRREDAVVAYVLLASRGQTALIYQLKQD